MATNLGMIQVTGTTYRLLADAERHEVIRVSDDRTVGVFVHRPALQVVHSEVGCEALMAVARAALRAGRLGWEPAARPKKRAVNAARVLAEMAFALWPIA